MERHRIYELFPESVLDKLVKIRTDPKYTDNNQRAEDIIDLLSGYGFSEIGPGTNRICMRNVDYVYKIAMDSYGVRDNWNEFNLSPELQPDVPKTYESNGTVTVAEYGTLMTKSEFMDSREIIRAMLDKLSDDYLFCDISLQPKNFTNFGYRLDGTIMILDFAYIYPIDPKIMFCKKCGSRIQWNANYDKLVCTRCGRRHDPIEIRDRMWKKESSFKPREKMEGENEDGVLVINI